MANSRPGRDPRLTALDIFVGEWAAQVEHPAIPDSPAGRVTFAWELEGRYEQRNEARSNTFLYPIPPALP